MSKHSLNAVLVLSTLACAVPTPLLAANWYVDSVRRSQPATGIDWDNAFPSLQQALAVAQAGDRILIATGTYHPNDDGSATPLPPDPASTFSVPDGVALQGGYPSGGGEYNAWYNPTILSGRLWQLPTEPGGSALHVVTVSDANVNLWGLMIVDGLAEGIGEAARGAGLYARNSTVWMFDCRFYDNAAANHGGAIYLRSSGLIMINTVFEGNSAALFGGAIGGIQAGMHIANCTFLNNNGGTFGGAIAVQDGRVNMWNTIAWRNAPDAFLPFGQSTFSVFYSCIQGGYEGPGNISDDPLLHKYAPLPGSPCIDSGSGYIANVLLTTDIANNARIIDDPFSENTGDAPGPIDMGAFEYDPAQWASTPDTLYVDRDAQGFYTGRDWENAFTNLQTALAIARAPATNVTTIEVAPGTYTPDVDVSTGRQTFDRHASFHLVGGVTVKGAFADIERLPDDPNDLPDATILSGDLNGDDLPVIFEHPECFEARPPTHDDTGLPCSTLNADGNTHVELNDTQMDDNVIHLVVADQLTEPATLYGLMITRAAHIPMELNAPGGSGVRVVASDVDIDRCVVERNVGTSGAGIIAEGEPSGSMTVQLNESIVRHNVALNYWPKFRYAPLGGGGGGFRGNTYFGKPNSERDVAMITRSRFVQNFAYSGGGAIGQYSNFSLVVRDSMFLRNRCKGLGGAIDSRGEMMATNSSFYGNRSEWLGGGLFATGETAIVGCEFVGNDARGGDACRGGGGLYIYPTVSLTNCTIVRNVSRLCGSGVYAWSQSRYLTAAITNSIVWGNRRDYHESEEPATVLHQLGFYFEYSPLLDFSLTELPWEHDGSRNIVGDPKFVRNPHPGPDLKWGTLDDDYGDLRLRRGSPCIDAGSNENLPPDFPLIDIRGGDRFVDHASTVDTGNGVPPLIDIGAHEAINPTGPDYDGDGDVDMDDFGMLQACMAGPFAAPAEPACEAIDLDGDSDVDQTDFGLFQQCLNGPNVEPVAGCFH